jgi:hypothetical protein
VTQCDGCEADLRCEACDPLLDDGGTPYLAILAVRMPTRDELREMAEVGRRTCGRSTVVAL